MVPPTPRAAAPVTPPTVRETPPTVFPTVEKGISSEFVYMGDAGEWQDPFVGFPAANVRRMKAVRSAYDPLGTFSRLNWGGFKLGFD